MYYLVVDSIDKYDDKIFYVQGPFDDLIETQKQLKNIIFHEKRRKSKKNALVEKKFGSDNKIPEMVIIYEKVYHIGTFWSSELKKELSKIYVCEEYSSIKNPSKNWAKVIEELKDKFS